MRELLKIPEALIDFIMGQPLNSLGAKLFDVE
jgi:hypothetical protein